MKANPIVGQGTAPEAWQACPLLARLPFCEVDRLVPAGSRAVIVAPHPDDEVLGCGGLLQHLLALGRPVQLISVTDGTASHPGSRQWPAERLAAERPRESAEALRRLGFQPGELPWLRVGLADSQVPAGQARLQAFLESHLLPSDVVFATWSHDGHCDHEAVGHASRAAAEVVGATVHELPIWTWHWATPGDTRVPWQRARKVPLSAEMLARKRHAAQAFTSQLQGDPQAGLDPVLSATVLERLMQPYEVVLL
ncbi:PIG-L deacetylase family protein [Pseudomonas eucalypticola]|uniref:PIG-L family deacetylase n=1 Tax=Pseudomonas eucalypticola TaxID=2599595 RepID=A0A7D5DAV3_9PSED|nr:PIG-L family deacetylase [Pseudomonas eucalypticola]QKZ05601.1 PIG-L family deacetylase [Pseudomonas eucalypticola]